MLEINKTKTLINSTVIPRLFLGLCFILIITIISSGISHAAPVTGFSPGRIIDDEVFTNSSSMTVDQIQAFLNSKVPVCDNYGTGGSTPTSRRDYFISKGYPLPLICLKDYQENGKSSAQIIYDVAQIYQINPQVLIVLLQKEQALVTDDWPDPSQYKHATGYGCPDGAACDTVYNGFTNQVTWAARTFRKFIDGSFLWPNYIVGNNTIYYNPGPYNNSAGKYYGNKYDKDSNSIPDITYCGGSTVNIQNRATQALYNYTPYQPNAAALNAGYLSGDNCSAYGNRNFYLYFTDWFGATTSAATYGYSILSKEFYSNNTYDTAVSEPLTIEPGQKIYAKITVKNTGNQAWYNDNLHLGTLDPRDRGSVFASDGWLGSDRPAIMNDSYVGTGETTTFQFTLKAPLDLGSYQESFGVLIEGYRWLDGTFTIPITVASTSPYYFAETISFDIYSDAAMTNKLDSSNITKYTDSEIYAKAVIKNTGNQTLPAGLTRLAASNPIDRTSLLSNNSWLDGRSRAATAQEGDILPQGTGTFIFSMTIPSTPLAQTREQFGLLIEDNRWLSYSIGSISIQTIQRPLSFLGTTVILSANESLLSNNEKYKLILQGDGNLVLYNEQWKALWASWTVGKGGIYLVMQDDGNLVLYDKNWIAIWNSRTSGKNISSLNMQDDGNLVIYNRVGYTWASWTVQ